MSDEVTLDSLRVKAMGWLGRQEYYEAKFRQKLRETRRR